MFRQPVRPNSRLFLNPLYIDVEAVEEFDRDDAVNLAAEIARVARRRTGRLLRRRGAQDCRRCARHIGVSPRTAAENAARILQPIGRNAAASWKTLRHSRPCGRNIPAHGGNGLMNGARPPTMRCGKSGKAIPTTSAFTNSCNGTPSANSDAAATLRAGTALLSASTSTLRSASMPAVPTPGWRKASCCVDYRSAHRRTSSIRQGKTGASPRIIRTAWWRAASNRSARCCARPCATPARCASIMCSA